MKPHHDVRGTGAESMVSVWVEPGTVEFPQSADVPLIMVGPGTGSAPFRSVIHDRTSQQIPGSFLHGLYAFVKHR